MPDLPQHFGILSERGFSIDSTERWWVLTFPDGGDGVLVERVDAAALDVPALVSLAESRVRAVRAITTLFAENGWGMRSAPGGRTELGSRHGSSSEIHMGWPLTFWLRRLPCADAVRRFAGSFSDSGLSDADIEGASRRDSSARSRALFAEHCRRVAEVEGRAVELEVDPVALEDLTRKVDALTVQHAAEHAARVQEWIVSSVVDAQMEAEIGRARTQIRSGSGMWLGASPEWVTQDDDWIDRDEWLAWAAALPDRGLRDGGAHVLMRFAPQRFRAEIEALLIGARRSEELEGDVSDARLAAHFLDVTEIADWVVSPDPWKLGDVLADAGYPDALFEVFARIRSDLSGTARKEAKHLLFDIEETLNDAGDYFGALLVAEDRERLRTLCRDALAQAGEGLEAALIAQAASRVAGALGDTELAGMLLGHGTWHAALLQRSFGTFAVLKQSILALSRILPGAACAKLIESACEDLDAAYEPHYFDTTALALAIAWRRCRRSVA